MNACSCASAPSAICTPIPAARSIELVRISSLPPPRTATAAALTPPQPSTLQRSALTRPPATMPPSPHARSWQSARRSSVPASAATPHRVVDDAEVLKQRDVGLELPQERRAGRGWQLQPPVRVGTEVVVL